MQALVAKQYKIAVLFGGASPEYEVSLKSAYSVISALGHVSQCEAVLIGINRAGEWFCFDGSLDRILDDTWNNPQDCKRALISPDKQTKGVLIIDRNELRALRIDAALPILHGKNGEDGTIQGLMELAGIPLIGSGSLASALCMDKDKAHKLAAAAGVCVPRSFVASAKTPLQAAHEQARHIGYPLFVKPVKAGSSFGISKVLKQSGLKQAIDLALTFDDAVIIEETIEGFEVGAAILGTGSHILVGEVDEIELAGSFFDYGEKYSPQTSVIHVPARITKHKALEVKSAARAIYHALGCSGFARIDLFITPSGTIVFNEANTIPGFTQHSRYPNMLKAAGLSFEQVINTMIEAVLPVEQTHHHQQQQQQQGHWLMYKLNARCQQNAHSHVAS
ncbi:MAG: D-alanine--D-serine ligase VanG [Coriobacteriia bacterium]|nr:D-alanine--D-serine ligase VanG [Coriobacteriia bacterium]